MKYWLYLAGKLALGGLVIALLQRVALGLYPAPPDMHEALFLHDLGFTFLVLGIWHVAAALLVFIIWDQRRRCRACLRRLIMPVATGTWGRTIFGRPCTEWICAYGHGTLTIQELQITGRQLPDWQPHDDDIWKELESYYQARK